MTKNILIVDDSATMRKIIMRGLRHAGIDDAEFEEAADGIQGMAALAAGSFDLILSDVDMPRLNGVDFVKAVSDKIPTGAPPIVMIATEGSEEVVQQAISCGAKGYLNKPLTPEKIQEVIGPFLK